jgi:peptidoglycan/xylan/chitin deacetylase (PgdA/CDA1 family)
MSNAGTLHRIPARPWRWLPWLVASQLAVILVWVLAGWHWGLPLMVASHALFMVPIFLPNSRFYAPVLSRWPEGRNSVWLTIDDGPVRKPAPCSTCWTATRRATFFLVGERALAQPELVQEILRRGHDLGNHSHSPRRRFWRLGPAAMRAEIEGCQRHPAGGKRPAGALVPLGGGHDQSVRGAGAAADGAWSGQLERCDGVGCTPDGVLRAAADLCPGAIVLLHEGAAHGHNLVIIERGLQALDERGAEGAAAGRITR